MLECGSEFVAVSAVEIVEVDIGAAVINPGDRAAAAKGLHTVRGTRAFSWATPIKTTP